MTFFELFFWYGDHKIELWSQSPLFFTKDFLLFKNGQKKCPKSKSRKYFPNDFFEVLYNKLEKVLKEINNIYFFK